MILFQFLLGASLASFLNLTVTRNLRHESIISPRSHCDKCKEPLPICDLIPVINYVFLKGKCRFCHQRIPLSSPILELMLGICFSVTQFRPTTIPSLLNLLILTHLSLFDFKRKQLPIWGILGLLIVCLLSCHHTCYQLLIAGLLYCLCLALNYRQLFVGNGDIDVFFCLWICLSISHLLWISSIACVSALLYLIIAPWPKDNKIPFVPFITVGYFIVVHYANILIPLITGS
ncbi:prepilin peptidase [Lentilactobacillus raoultii]|uniref:Prepilin peptidase n=1 Tax=Lentilactobacillus raoultii TaxID=1987503 RepID=A0ABW3PE85_9LACO|nr:A24 family peptidase [Lentilactobacillus raoultii]